MNGRLLLVAGVTSAVILAGPVASRLDGDRMLRDPGPAPATAELVPPIQLGPDGITRIGLVIGGELVWIGSTVGAGVPVRCAEDDACWDCHADGNGICGTVTP